MNHSSKLPALLLRLCTKRISLRKRNMSMRPFDDFFFRPAHRLHLFPSHHHISPYAHWPSMHWPSLRMSETEDEFDDFIRSVDNRFSGMLANVHHPPRDVDVEHSEEPGEEGKPKKYHMKIAVQDFRPEDIKVKVQGDNLVVEAKREEKKEQEGMYAHSYREFKRTFNLPEGVEKKKLTSALSTGGILEIEAPIVYAIEDKKPEEKQQIEVSHMEE